MSVPKRIEKIISKGGDIVDYDSDRIIKSIALTITDVEHATQWITDRRAQMCYETINKAAYDAFYNLHFLLKDFFKKYISFEPEERYRRLENSRVMERLLIVLLEEFKSVGEVQNNIALAEFIEKEIDGARLEEKYRLELFPSVTESEKSGIIDFLSERVLKLSRQTLVPEQLYPARDFVMDMIEQTLKKIGEIEIAEGFMIFREGKKKIRDGEITTEQFTRNGIHYEMCRKTLEWNIENKCEKIFDLNDWVRNRDGKDIGTLIKMSDKRFKEDVDAVAKKILGRVGEVRIIIIAGPSCSNKTTTTVIIGKALSQAGLKLKQLNVDDYFKNLEDQPKDEFGDYDFEMPEAIDIDLLNENCRDLIGGKSIQKPRYNFKTGHRESYAEFRLEKDEILLIDCLHGLYRRLTASVPAVNKFSIYIESMNILRDTENMYTRWADIRMLKRMIRDVKYRNYSTEQTLAHWPYVRKGELKHILPYILSTDAVINAGLPYELPALKKSLENIMPPSEFIDNLRKEGRLDAYIRGVRVKSLLETVDPIEDLSIIPATSPLREFIGGSAYAIPHNE